MSSPTYYSYVHAGLSPHAVGGALKAEITIQRDGATLDATAPTLRLRTDAEVLALDPKVIGRRFPAPGATDVILSVFPFVELTEPDLPWRFSAPTRAGESGPSLDPWLVLVTVERARARLVDATRDLPARIELALADASGEVPNAGDLARWSEAWAWAHAQGDPPTCARVVSPRHLLPDREYLVALVPRSAAAIAAGSGGAATGILALPCFDSWTFRTGPEGHDPLALARRLRPLREVPDSVGSRSVDASTPGAGMSAAPGRSFPYAPPLVLRMEEAAPETALAQAIGDAMVPLSDEEGDPILALPEYAPPAQRPADAWDRDPRWRLAAGLGRELVARHQEELVGLVLAGEAEHRQAERRRGSALLAGVVSERHAARLRRLVDPAKGTAEPLVLASRALGHARAAGGPTLATELSEAGSASAFTPELRRLLRSGGPVGRALGREGRRDSCASRVAIALHADVPAVFRWSPLRAPAVGSGRKSTPPSLAPALPAPSLPPKRPPRPRARALPVALAPWLAELGPDLLLPGFSDLPRDCVVAVATDPRVIEAVLAGANQALHEELRWREIRVAAQTTLLDRFWQPSDPEVSPLEAWTAPLGHHGMRTPSYCVLFRGELFRQFPNLEATLRAGDASTPPALRLPIADDGFLVGFTRRPSVGAKLHLVEPAVGVRFGTSAPPSDPASPYFTIEGLGLSHQKRTSAHVADGTALPAFELVIPCHLLTL